MSQKGANCREYVDNWKITAPTLISQLNNADNPLETFCVLCEEVLIFADLNDMDGIVGNVRETIQTSYHQVFKRICDLVQSQSQIEGANKKIKEELDQVLQVLATFDAFMLELCNKITDALKVCQTENLISLTLDMIKNSYCHCKDSTVTYGAFLSSFSNELTTMFRKVHTLQGNLLALIDKVDKNGSENDTKMMVHVVITLHEICTIAGALDVKVGIILWKFILKLVPPLKESFSEPNTVMLIQSLKGEVVKTCDYLKNALPSQSQSDNTSSFMKSFKMLGFQLRVTAKLVEELGGLLTQSTFSEVVDQVYSCIGFIDHCWNSLSTECTSEIDKQILASVKSLIKSCAKFQCFYDNLFQHQTNYASDLQLKLSLFAASVILQLNVNSLQRNMIFKYLFSLVKICEKDFLERCRGITWNTSRKDQQENQDSLYSQLYSELRGFFTDCDDSQAEELELEVWNQLIEGCWIQYLMASDLIMFISQAGPGKEQLAYCTILAQPILHSQHLQTHLAIRCEILLSRLLSTVPELVLQDFVKTYPFANNVVLWQNLNVKRIGSGKNFSSVLTKVAIAKLQSYLADSNYNLALACLKCITNSFASEGSMQSQQLANSLPPMCINILQIAESDSPEILQLHAESLKLLSSVLHCMKFEDLSQTLEKLYQTCLLHPNKHPFILASIQFVHKLSISSLQFEQQDKTHLMNLVQGCYSAFLSHTNLFLSFCAIQYFAVFAEQTEYDHLVTACLEGDENMQEKVVCYLQQISSGAVGDDISPSALEEIVKLERKVEKSQRLSVSSGLSNFDMELQTKRRKTDSDHFSENIAKVLEHLDAAEKLLTSTVSSLGHGQEKLPVTLLQKLKEMVDVCEQYNEINETH